MPAKTAEKRQPMSKSELGGIIVLDFGGQYTQLIARRIREQQVFSAILPCTASLAEIRAYQPVGIVLSGSPCSVYDAGAPICDPGVLSLDVPVLGIFYGLQWISHTLVGKVERAERREYGPAEVDLRDGFALFALRPDEIDVLVHPQSIIHGMVEFSDRSVVAQLGAPDMRTPIAHCLGWPDRIVGPAAKLDLAKIGQLTFEAPDFGRFPGLRLAYDALRSGRGATTVYNAANEVAVAAFIAGKIRFGAIARLVEATMEDWIRSGNLAPLTSADDAIAVDHTARYNAATLLPQIALKAT